MQPLQELLHRIEWDPAFGAGRFALAYEDRMAPEEAVVPLTRIRFDPTRPGTFSIVLDDGRTVHIPLHRVRTVFRDGQPIWRRPTRPHRGQSPR